MVDNQHKQIKGYRDLTQAEIDLMNECKSLAIKVGELCDKIFLTPNIEQRWFAIGKTDLQKGFIAIIRSIAKPETF